MGEAQKDYVVRKIVSDDFVLELVSKKINLMIVKTIILDGFPRNLSQASSLDDLLKLGVSIEYVFLIDVPNELIIKRCIELHVTHAEN